MALLQNVTHKVLQATHGRTTAFFISFFIVGNIFAWLGKLTPVYVGFMGTLGSLVLGHSIKEDIMEAKRPWPPGGPDADDKT
ncbi:MAG: hypothetical protein ACRD33_03765 [Candidatus Acidiferrales bacterium]